MRAAGVAQSLTDTIYNLNQQHLSPDAVTVYEALEDAGHVAGAVNITCYRGRTRHNPTLPWVTKPAFGPKRFFFYSLFESDATGAPLAVRNRAAGSIDAYAAAVGRWLVTRDGFDFLAYYLSDFDYASHTHGPLGADDVALERTDAAIQALLDAAGGPDEFLERYAVILHSDHGQTHGRPRGASSSCPSHGSSTDIVVTASNRAGQVYLLPDARVEAADLARSLDGEASVETTLRREGGEAVARREGEELRFRPNETGWEMERRPLDPRPSRRAAPKLVGARAIRTPASCSCPPPRAGSSSTSAAATTRAAEATARSSRATRSSRS